MIIKSREEIHKYLAVRHLIGIRKWEPMAQAKYIHNEIKELMEHNNYTIMEAVTHFSKENNLKENNIHQGYYQYTLYTEFCDIIGEKDIDKYSLDDKFSLLEISFGKKGSSSVTKYLSIEPYKTLAKNNKYEDIIEEDNYDKVKNFLHWVFKKNEPVIRESRDIPELKKILEKPASTKAFEDGASKEDVLFLANPPEEICNEACRKIIKQLVNIEKHYCKIKKMSEQKSIQDTFKESVLEKADTVKKVMNIKNE